MPARLSSMELESLPPAADAAAADQPGRRKSGRVIKKPNLLDPSEHMIASASGKRKRAAVTNDAGDDVDEIEADEDDEDEDEDDADESDDHEASAGAARKKSRPVGAKKNAAKRPKTNGNTNTLAIRPAKSQTTAAVKTAKARRPQDPAAEDVGGLYAEVFARGDSIDDITASWLSRFNGHQSNAMTEIVNFVLRCAGCAIGVDAVDVEDPDNCAKKLTEIQDEFQAQNVFEYPLIAKNRSGVQFKKTMTMFCSSLIKSIAQSQLLYESPELIENIQVWVSTMSSAGSRPFRHTATVVALTIISALAEVGRSLKDSRAKTLRQSEGEQKKGRVNSARVKDLQKQAQTSAEKAREVDSIISDWFDTVFVHRYRDVDPRIRVECVGYLSDWITIYPDLFFDGQHLRYLGWLLGDTHAPTRLEVLRNLQKVYVDEAKIGGLRQFTERFRARMVEMASRDAEINVRVSAIELLNILREAGLLEPDDIDTIGKLVYDSEARVRKAVAPFFVASVDETYSSKVDDLGGIEALEGVIPIETSSADYEIPQLGWLKIKCLAELLLSFDPEGGDFSNSAERSIIGENETLVAAGVESRLSLVADAFLDYLPELKEWEILAGYLLYDHSDSRRKSRQDDVKARFHQECKLEDKEEVLLLHLLGSAVRASLTQVAEATSDKRVKKTKLQMQELRDSQENAAYRLAQLMPKLLNRFGAASDAASAVLRLCRVLNLDTFQNLRQDSNTYSALLDDINKQIMSHDDANVLSAARDALLMVRSFEEMDEITSGKFQALWDDLMHHFSRLCHGAELSKRGSLRPAELESLAGIVLRMANLACVSDCTQALETKLRAPQSKSKKRESVKPTETVLSALLAITTRGAPVSGTTHHVSELENGLVASAIKCVFFYFVWSVQELVSTLKSKSLPSDSSIEELRETRSKAAQNILHVIRNLHGVDELRLLAAGFLLDLHSMFAILKGATSANSPEDVTAAVKLLQFEIDAKSQAEIIKVFTAAEKDYASKSKKTLEPAPDDEPEDFSDDDDDEEDDQSSLSSAPDEIGDDENLQDAEQARAERTARKQRTMLFAEERLCVLASKIVVAIVAGVLDIPSRSHDTHYEGPVQKRLCRNKAKLGQNFKEVVAALEPPKAKRAAARPRLKPARAEAGRPLQPQQSNAALSNELVADEDGEDDDEDEEGDPIDEDGLEELHELQARGLIVDGIDDDEEEEDDAAEPANEDVDSVMGD